jgi:2-keto-4-pentenoate hydratase/2-oxohepta-3-ene-1,7-dioic acid hydratase in catechol pathway
VRLARLGAPGRERPVVIDGDRPLDLSPVTDDIDGDFLAADGLDRVRRALAAGSLPVLEGASALRVGAAIARPSAVLCIGMNYAAHAAESGAPPPEEPILFLKTPNTVVGPNDPIVLPRGSTKTDWEVELGVVIGKRASYLDAPEQAWDCIAGYVACNDLSERDFQLGRPGGQWSKGKCAAGFSPVGPWFVTADDVAPGALRLRSWVNGEPRQDSTTADLIFDVAFLIWHLSQYLTLEPGDLVMTGTPEGVALSGRFPYLRSGDVVTVEIEGLGRQEQSVTDHD